MFVILNSKPPDYLQHALLILRLHMNTTAHVLIFNCHLKIIFTSIDTWSWCSTAHFTIDTPPTNIVSLQTLAAAIDDNRCTIMKLMINRLIVTTFMWEALLHLHNCFNIIIMYYSTVDLLYRSCMNVCIYECVCVCLCTHTCIYTHVHTHAHT